MGYEKLKKEQYANIGGINTKASVYVTGERELLDIKNYDFSTPGALTPRWGMTQGLANTSFVFGASNRLNFGFQVMDLPAYSSTSAVNYANVAISLTGAFTINANNSNAAYTRIVTGVTTPLVTTDGRGVATQVTSEARSTAFLVAGNVAYKSAYDGTNSTAKINFYGLPEFPTRPTISQTGTLFGGFAGTNYFKVSYVDSYGYVGPSSGTLTYTTSGSDVGALVFNAMTFTQQALWSDAVAIAIYYTAPSGIPGVFLFGHDYDLVGYSGITQVFDYLNLATTPDTYPGETRPNDLFQDGLNPVSIADNVEYYSNRLFWGSSSRSNYLLYSEPIETQADAESILPENTLTLPNQDYPFIASKAYNQTLMVFNQVGVTRLTGNALENFQAVELTREYGLLASRAIVEWQERLWFLDQNFIVEYNGANFTIVSDRIESFIRRINTTAAPKTATAYHFEERREVWFAVPIDGSNENNIVLVYDYQANGWTTFTSSYSFNFLHEYTIPITLPNTTSGASLGASPTYQQTRKQVYVSTPGGSFTYFGQSFTTDNGTLFTQSFKTRNHAEQGHSVTSLWRRLYLDTGAYGGLTLPFSVRFYANFATATISLTKAMYEIGSNYSGQQQTRLDFGIPAKALSMEFFYTGSTAPHRVYGYTIERRFLRNV